MFDPAVVQPAVDVLASLRRLTARLEFAIGTGRIAMPLADRGVRVAGIDNSDAMLARLREKPGAERIEAVLGDIAETRVDGEFSLVYLVFNTIGNLTTQDAQVACFENAAAHLRSGGRFVIEVGVPSLQLLPVGQTIVPFHAGPNGLGFDVYDVVTQNFSSQHYVVRGRPRRDRPRRFPLRLAGRVRPDGAHRRDAAGAPLGGLGPGAVHGHQLLARLGLRQALSRR